MVFREALTIFWQYFLTLYLQGRYIIRPKTWWLSLFAQSWEQSVSLPLVWFCTKSGKGIAGKKREHFGRLSFQTATMTIWIFHCWILSQTHHLCSGQTLLDLMKTLFWGLRNHSWFWRQRIASLIEEHGSISQGKSGWGWDIGQGTLALHQDFVLYELFSIIKCWIRELVSHCCRYEYYMIFGFHWHYVFLLSLINCDKSEMECVT